MENTLLVLGFFLIVVGIPVVFGILGEMQKRRMKLREKELEILGARTAEKAAQYAAQVEQLETRVRVLEGIVTDEGFDTAVRIEALRKPRLTKGGNA